jgi:hypothetical protein
MMQSHGYLSRLLPPMHDWESEELETREHVEQGDANEDERQVIISELERANWPADLADKMTRKSHPLQHPRV